MAELICLGSCNPARRDVDADVAKDRRLSRNEGEVLAVPDDLAFRLRRLVHTEHRATDRPGWYRCVVCLCERKWGATFD